MTILETTGLTKRYKGKAVVDSVSLKVEAGQLHGFLGPNGSGKTTTLGMMLGVLRPHSGVVSLFGVSGGAALQQARRRVGAFLEQPNFIPYLSGKDNLALVANIKSQQGKRCGAKEIKEQLGLVGLDAVGKREFRHYSLGMKQRLALAAALLGGPELLILDEPTNGLDPEGIHEIRELMKSLVSNGITILVSSHLLSEVEKMCTHISIIRKGKLLRSDSLARLINSKPRYLLRGSDLAAIAAALANCPVVESVDQQAAQLEVSLQRDEPEVLSRFLAERQMFLSALIPVVSGLEEEYFRVTADEADSAAGVVP